MFDKANKLESEKVDKLLNESRFLERLVGAVLIDGFKCLRGEFQGDAPIELRNKNPLFLEIGLTPPFANRIELRRARSVGIAATDLGALFSYGTNFCHKNNQHHTTHNREHNEWSVVGCPLVFRHATMTLHCMQLETLFGILILVFSIVIHEVMHGVVANWLGDPTARLAGRLTLNPLKHIDPLGSIIIPALLVITNSNLFFGWAKPVPYNAYNLKNARWGEAMVAGAGPGINLLIAVIF